MAKAGSYSRQVLEIVGLQNRQHNHNRQFQLLIASFERAVVLHIIAIGSHQSSPYTPLPDGAVSSSGYIRLVIHFHSDRHLWPLTCISWLLFHPLHPTFPHLQQWTCTNTPAVVMTTEYSTRQPTNFAADDWPPPSRRSGAAAKNKAHGQPSLSNSSVPSGNTVPYSRPAAGSMSPRGRQVNGRKKVIKDLTFCRRRFPAYWLPSYSKIATLLLKALG